MIRIYTSGPWAAGPKFAYIYHTVKNFGGKKLWRIRTVGSLVENLGKLKSIYIGNVMEIVKIGKKLGELL